MTVTKLLVPLALAAVALTATPRDEAAPTNPAPALAAPVPHCQVPCGVFSDKMRIDMMMEDAATIEKAMKQATDLAKASPQNLNQIIRWTTTKDHHADHIQEVVAYYWFAQRIKAPADDAGAEATAKYVQQLKLLHGITVAAMKSKQGTDASWVAKIRKLALEFSGTYFSKEDLEHLRSHHHDHDGHK